MSETQTTLRETLSAELDKVEAQQETPQQVEQPNETPEQKAERLRDEKGRFAPGGVAPKSDQGSVGKDAGDIQAQTKQPVNAGEQPSKPRPARPSSWKKDYWDHWEKLDPNLAEYLSQREQEYAKGVSTYKQEWDRAKPIIEAMAQFQPILQQHNIDPSQWISNLGNAHYKLAMGKPEEKLAMFARLAQDYQVPLQGLFTQGQDGQIYFNQQLAQQQQQQQPDIRSVVQQMLIEQSTQQEVERARTDKENYPHLEQVRNTMAGLLQSGLAEDLKSAYESAIRLPQHSDIWEALQQQQRQQDEAKRAEDQKKRVSQARANAFSPKSATPSDSGKTSGKQGLRATIESAADEVLGGRV